MQNRVLLLLLSMMVSLGAMSQQPKTQIKENVSLSASNYLAYPGPKQVSYTAPPKGKTPFYMSHYGRHGSRYLNSKKEYDYPYFTLLKADTLGKLTPLGKDVLRRVALMRQEATNKLGELTPLGYEQQRQIAKRMMEHFPEIFEGDAHVDAKSTTVLRCVMSMESALLQMAALNPQLKISHSASYSDMYYMFTPNNKLYSQTKSHETMDSYANYCERHLTWKRPMSQLFTDQKYLDTEVNGPRLNYHLFHLASALQNTEQRMMFTLYDLFTDEELIQNWRMENAFWFLGYSHTPANGAVMPFTQRILLRKLIEEADSCIKLRRPGASLRFGHETIIMPLVALMGINGYDMRVKNLDRLERYGWVNYNVFPMAANIQLVFYRSSRNDSDPLVKVLLNENEATLPVKTDCAPYYHWKDMRQYYLEKLATYEE